MNIKIEKKDDIILKILHYFITEEDYKPVIINGLQNEIWLENMESNLKLIRINTNYIHNNVQLETDTYKARTIMNSIKKNTFSFNINMLNLILDAGDAVDVSNASMKNVETIKVNNINDFKKNRVVSEFFPKVKDAILNDKIDYNEFFKLTEDMNEKTIRNEKKLARIFSQKKPVVTYALMAINVALYLYFALFDRDGVLKTLFANNYLLVRNGEFFRLFTCMFLHVDLVHLACNMYALYLIGPQVERYYGRWRFLLIYLVSGLLGSVFSCVFMGDLTFSMGASGAIFGLFGSVAYFTYYYRATLQGLLRSSILPTILINLCLGFMIPGIDIWAHIGGLIGGILVSMGIGIGDKGRKADQINGILVLVIMFIFMMWRFITK